MRSKLTYGVLPEVTARITSVAKGCAGKRQEPRVFLGEDVRDGEIRLLGMPALMGDLVAPAAKLGIQVVDIGKGARRKEAMAEVLDLAFDFSLLVAAARRTRTGREVIVPGELE